MEDIKILEEFANESILYGSTVAITLEEYKDIQLATKKLLKRIYRIRVQIQ